MADRKVGLLDIADSCIVDAIVRALGGVYGALALRATSRQFRALIEAPPRVREKFDIARIFARIGDIARCEEMLARDEDGEIFACIAAAAGECGNRAMCQYMLKKNQYVALPDVIFGAAKGGNRALCYDMMDEMTRSSDPMTRAGYFQAIALGAVSGGHIGLLNEAKEWCTQYAGVAPSLRELFTRAVTSANIAACQIVYDWALADGQELKMTEALCSAVILKEWAVCEWLIVHGARDFARVMQIGEAYGEPELCEMARKWMREL